MLKNMTLSNLNPFIRSAGCYEIIQRSEECCAYDARLIYLISGDIAVSLNGGKAFHLTAGNLLYIPAGMRYKLSGKYLRAVVIAFDATDTWCAENERIPADKSEDFIEERCHICDVMPFDRSLHAEDMESERDEFIKIANIATSAEGHWREEISARVKLLLLRLAETVSENALPARMVDALDTYIRENCADEITNTEIGAIFGYHPFYVSRVLKERKGTTLRQYIISYRLKAAKKLLSNTKKSISDIATETGFTDASYFTKTFRATFGITPKDYRNQFKNEFI